MYYYVKFEPRYWLVHICDDVVKKICQLHVKLIHQILLNFETELLHLLTYIRP